MFPPFRIFTFYKSKSYANSFCIYLLILSTPLPIGRQGEIFKSYRSVEESFGALAFNNVTTKISSLRDLVRNKNRKGLSIILRSVEISFKFHRGIGFDTIDDIFDKNFLFISPRNY
jgi:hypothetical protein